MSTRKIHEALSAMRSCIKSGEPWTPTMEAARAAALAEVEAIEKAAQTMRRCDIVYPTSTAVSDVAAAVALFASIAK
jgi:tagatose-1,6-bisphosphate aldolase non-catalytic subunit AgaZ/GatZ